MPASAGDPNPLFPIRERLAPYRGARDDPPPPDRGASAAVSLILRPAPDDPGRLEILLIKRALRASDPWSGHMALPGGRREEGDRSLLETAVRETREETGVRLPAGDGLLGRLPELRPRSPRLPRVVIAPFVFAVEPGTPATPRSPEVAETTWTPLDLFHDPSHRDVVRVHDGAARLAFPAVRLPSREPVWGLTYRILEALLGLPDRGE